MRGCVCALVLIALAAQAAACKEEGTVKVRSLTFKGVKSVDEARLKSVLATRESSRIPWGKKYGFDRARFEADLKRIQAFYADRGFADARVTGFDVKLNDKQDAVDLTVSIDEGEPVRVTAIDFVGFDPLPPQELDALKSRLAIKVGAPRDRQLVAGSLDMAVNDLKEHGRPYAKVTMQETLEGDGNHQSQLTFTAQAGKFATFGRVEIAGNTTVSSRDIERQLTFKPGEPYKRSLVQDSQKRLYGIELFQFVNVEGVNVEQQPDQLPMRVTVVEGKHQRVNFGVGYGSDEKARAEGEYHHVNFLGGGRTAGAHGRYSSLDRGIRLDFNEPYVFSPHFAFAADGQQWITFAPAYSSSVTGGRVSLTHRGSERTSWAASIIAEHDSSTVSKSALEDPSLYTSLIALGLNPITGKQNGTLSAIAFDAQHSTADSRLDARRGYQLAFHVEQAGRLLPGTFKYTAVSIDARHYLALRYDAVLASRVQVANLRPIESQDNVPFGKLYFLGGASSNRGWGRYEISPLSPSGLPIGGDSLLGFNEEFRKALRGNFHGVVFLDGGNVWADSWAIRLGDLRYAIGPGLRYQTPVGPLRVDFGYQLNPIPGLVVNDDPHPRRWRIHFSIGQAF